MRIGQLIRSFRAHREYNLKEMAGRIGIPISTLSRIERGQSPDGKTLAAILKWALGDVDVAA